VPYEASRATYRQRYPRPVVVAAVPLLWRAVVARSSIARALDLFLLLGFVPFSNEEDLAQCALDAGRTEPIRLRLVLQDGPKQVSWFEDSSQTPGADPLGNSTYGGTLAAGSSPAADRVRDLEQEVRELTKQLRILKAREVASNSSTAAVAAAASTAASAASPAEGTPVSPELIAPTPQIVLGGKGLIASTTGGSLVCVPVNYLDPDLVPYVIGLSGHGTQRLIPCTVVEHRFVVFVAPPANRGSFAMTLLCTVGAQLRRYAKSVWLEYKPSDTVLSHHAVNQLVNDIPLPSSATLGDPSDGTELKSEAASCIDDQDDAASECSAGTSGLMPEPHLPLTREMLDMIPASGFPHQSGGGSRVTGSLRRSVANSECSEPTLASFVPAPDTAALSVLSVASVVSDAR
jgi:hypothetical protein